MVYIGNRNKTNSWRAQVAFRGKKYSKLFPDKSQSREMGKAKKERTTWSFF